jgi:hypothetical protein
LPVLARPQPVRGRYQDVPFPFGGGGRGCGRYRSEPVIPSGRGKAWRTLRASVGDALYDKSQARSNSMITAEGTRIKPAAARRTVVGEGCAAAAVRPTMAISRLTSKRAEMVPSFTAWLTVR